MDLRGVRSMRFPASASCQGGLDGVYLVFVNDAADQQCDSVDRLFCGLFARAVGGRIPASWR